MKEKGYKHEDELMKENAKLQVQNGLRSMRGRFFKYMRPRIEEKTFVYVAEVRCTSSSLRKNIIQTELRRLRLMFQVLVKVVGKDLT